jgi:hypothetical protein
LKELGRKNLNRIVAHSSPIAGSGSWLAVMVAFSFSSWQYKYKRPDQPATSHRS